MKFKTKQKRCWLPLYKLTQKSPRLKISLKRSLYRSLSVALNKAFSWTTPPHCVPFFLRVLHLDKLPRSCVAFSDRVAILFSLQLKWWHYFLFEFYYFFLYRRFLLVIYFIQISVYMSIPISQFILPTPRPAFPPWCPYICPLHLCLYFCSANRFICTIFLYSTYMH